MPFIKGSVPIYVGVRESNRGRLLFWVCVSRFSTEACKSGFEGQRKAL